ncbi:7TM GPCR protein [Aphelenchoides avenae]|nr:7TM GPCR protein [Aphelenchus avenae]
MSGTSMATNEVNIHGIPEFYSAASGACLVAGTFLNVFLIWLVCTQSRRELASYKVVIVQSCVLDLIALFVAVLVQPIFNFVHGRFAMVQNGPFKGLEQPYSFMLSAVWFGVFYFCIVSNVLQFVYRYLMICRNTKLSFGKYMMLLIAGCSIASVHLVLLYFALYPAERPTEEFRQIVDRYLGVASGERVEISLMGQSMIFPCSMHCVYLLALEVICYGTVIFCSLRIKQAVNDSLSCGRMERKKMEIERQLTVSLLIQALIPFLAVVIVFLCLVFCNYAMYYHSTMTIPLMAYMSLPIPSVAVLNPLITIVVIQPYRQFVFGRGPRATSSVHASKQPNHTMPTHHTSNDTEAEKN